MGDPRAAVTPDDFQHEFAPGASGANGPVLLLLHGTGGDEHSLRDLGRALLPGAPLLGVRGRVLENGLPRFFRRIAEGVFDEADLIRRTHELAGLIPVVGTRYGFDPGQVVAVGYSNGANIAAATLLLRPGTLAGAVLFRAMVPLTPSPLPDLAGVPVLLAAGRHDSLVAPRNVEALAAMLRHAGADANLHWTDAGHQLTLPDIEAGRDWLTDHFARRSR